MSVPASEVVRIVGDAAIASRRLVEGRLVPLLIVDTAGHPQLAEFIRIQSQFQPGDVVTQWGQLGSEDGAVFLRLEFKRPVETTAAIKFDVVKQGILVDQILTARCAYLQAGHEGDRFVTNPEATRIFIEIPETGFDPAWDRIFRRHISKYIRSSGLSRKQAALAADQAIAEIRKFGQFRMRTS
jgi:hypothetical protein